MAAVELDAHAARELELIGRRWAPQILLLLARRPTRFSELLRGVPGLSKKVMGERLRELQEAGLVDRRVDAGPPITSTYALTTEGDELRPVLEGLATWALNRGRRRSA